MLEKLADVGIYSLSWLIAGCILLLPTAIGKEILYENYTPCDQEQSFTMIGQIVITIWLLVLLLLITNPIHSQLKRYLK